MSVALTMCLALVIALPLLAVGLLVTRSRRDRPAAPFPRPVGPQWTRDPTRRHEYRFWNGTRWTAEVSDRGALSTDPVTEY